MTLDKTIETYEIRIKDLLKTQKAYPNSKTISDTLKEDQNMLIYLKSLKLQNASTTPKA